MKRVSQLVALALLLPIGSAKGQVADTIFHKTPLFTPKDLGMAAAFGVATIAAAPLDRYFAHRLQDSSTQSNRWLHGAATGFRILGSEGSLAAGAGLYLIGRASKKTRTADVGLHSDPPGPAPGFFGEPSCTMPAPRFTSQLPVR